MTIFIVLFLYLIFIHSVTSRLKEEKARLIQVWACAIALWIILALRSPLCGVDLLGAAEDEFDIASSSYSGVFSKVKLRSWGEAFWGSGERMEKGWFILNKVIGLFAPYFQMFLAIIAAIQLASIGYVLYKKSEDIVLSFMVYACFGLYIMSFSGLRQATAYAITFLASYFLMEGKVKKFFIIVFMAFTFHQSALIFIFAYPLRKLKLNLNLGIYYVLLLLLFAPYMDIVANVLLGFLFSNRYSFEKEGSALTMFFVYILIFLISLIVRRQTEVDRFSRRMVFAAVACQSLGMFSAGHLTRIGFYFQMFFPLLFPSIVNYYGKVFRNKGVVWFALVAILIMFFCYSNSGDSFGVIPYQFFWETPQFMMLM